MIKINIDRVNLIIQQFNIVIIMSQTEQPRLKQIFNFPLSKRSRYVKLVKAMHRPAYYYAYWLVKDAGLAEVVIRNVFADMWNNPQILNHQTELTRRIVESVKDYAAVVIDFHQGNRAQRDFQNNKSLLMQLRVLLHDLSQDEIEPLVLQTVFKLTKRQISQHLKVDENTVASRLFTARTSLQMKLKTLNTHLNSNASDYFPAGQITGVR